ncbi:MAG: hypothetical protein HKN39_06240 [Flavobacteriales bacterium]|nr:hypothetical protein [Flavobacteriales bacterium]
MKTEKCEEIMKRLIVIAILAILASPAFSQLTVKRPKAILDYVVTQGSDTLWGEVRYGNHVFGSRLNKIVLIDEDGIKKKFKANSINGFFNDRHYYSTVNVDGYWYFARKVVEGTVNMYFFEYSFASNYHRNFMSQKDDIGVEGKIVTVLLERNGNVKRVFKGQLEKDVFPFLGDNTEIMNSLKKGDCSFDELDEVVMSYNKWSSEK